MVSLGSTTSGTKIRFADRKQVKKGWGERVAAEGLGHARIR